MARHRFLLTIAVCTSILSGMVRAEETPAPCPSATPPPAATKGPDMPGKPHDDHDLREPFFKDMRERFEKMPPEQRQRILEKFRKLQETPADEQAHVRFMQGEREKRAQQAVDDTIQSSGLKLDDTQKQKFTEIYKRERRKLEEQLRTEMDKLRKDRLPEMQKTVIASYQKEAAEPTPSATPAPSPSATP